MYMAAPLHAAANARLLVQQAQLPAWKVFGDSVMVLAPPFERVREPWRDPVMAGLLKEIRRLGLKWYWGRWFWTDSINVPGQRPTPGDMTDVEYYRRQIRAVISERVMLGADGSALDTEAYELDLNMPYKPSMPGDGPMTYPLFEKVRETAYRAAAFEGRVDLIMPAVGSADPLHYSWALSPMGRLLMCERTYQLTSTQTFHNIVGLAKRDKTIFGWGTHVTSDDANPAGRITTGQILSGVISDTVLMADVPHVGIWWMYAQDQPTNELAECMRRLGQATGSVAV